jgi:hypothetical protein
MVRMQEFTVTGFTLTILTAERLFWKEIQGRDVISRQVLIIHTIMVIATGMVQEHIATPIMAEALITEEAIVALTEIITVPTTHKTTKGLQTMTGKQEMKPVRKY